MNLPHRVPLLLSVACALLFTACGGKPAEAPKGPAAPTPEVLAKLAQADAVDGKTDKVVGKCGGCSLKMDGKPAFELAIGDYKLHFCKQGCLDAFTKDPNGQVLAMKVPQ